MQIIPTLARVLNGHCIVTCHTQHTPGALLPLPPAIGKNSIAKIHQQCLGGLCLINKSESEELGEQILRA